MSYATTCAHSNDLVSYFHWLADSPLPVVRVGHVYNFIYKLLHAG